MPEKLNQKLIKQVVFDSSKENWLHLDEMTWKRVTDLMVQWDVAEHPGVMH